MSTYKPFITSDVVVTPFKVNKSFTFKGVSEFTASNVCIDRYFGKTYNQLYSSLALILQANVHPKIKS